MTHGQQGWMRSDWAPSVPQGGTESPSLQRSIDRADHVAAAQWETDGGRLAGGGAAL